ncbi:MAG: nitroreductase [Atopobiaceae bacterium]|nr:nitroreductase [Atopobiaceae bacterium]
MDTLETLLTRRACRTFGPQQVDRDTLDRILEAGTFAPSGMGRQPWKFVVLRNPEQVRRLSALNARIMGVERDPFYGGKTVVVVLVDPEAFTGIEDGALAIGNMLNAAHALGVDSIWVHRAREEFELDEGKAMLAEWGVEGEWRGVGHCVLGYSAEPLPEAAPRKEGLITFVE